MVTEESQKTSFCFVIMPFRADLNFLYLYLREYLKKKYNLHVERGDHRITTKPIIEKIRDQILSADIILGDITGRNPNVFYELGLADAYGKPVILMTQDDPGGVPANIRHLDFVVYHLSNHEKLLDGLDNAIKNVFLERYRRYYKDACGLLKRFNKETSSTYAKATLEEFQARVMQGERIEDIPEDPTSYGYAAFLLPKILLDTANIKVMVKVTNWLSSLGNDDV